MIEYLPVSMLVPNRTDDWATLRQEFNDRQGRDKNSRDFKEWLTRTQGARFDRDSLSAAAKAVGVPEEVTALVQAISAAVRP